MLLQRYIARQVLGRTLAAAGVLASIYSLIELGTTGPVLAKPFGWAPVLRATALHLPLHATLMIPLAFLLGGAIAVLTLQARGEWEALSAAGAPPTAQAGRALARVSLVVLLLSAALAELVVPGCERAATDQLGRMAVSSLSGRARPGAWYAGANGWFVYLHRPRDARSARAAQRFSAWRVDPEQRISAHAEGEIGDPRAPASLRTTLAELMREGEPATDAVPAEGLSLRQLLRRIERQARFGRDLRPDRIMVQSRLAYLAYVIPIGLVLAALVAAAPRTSPIALFARAVVSALVFWGAIASGWQAAQVDLVPPAIAAWVPLGVCCAASAIYVRRAARLTRRFARASPSCPAARSCG